MKANAHRMRAGATAQGRHPAETAIPKRTSKAAGAGPVSAIELGEIYRQYASDLVRCAGRWGFTREEAEDFTQEFFLRLEEKDSLGTFDPTKGGFRSFLLTLFQRFLANQWHSLHTLRRGGTAVALPLGNPGEVDKALIDWRTPDKIAHLHWAHHLVEEALQTLRTDLARQGKARLFDILLPHLLHSSGAASYASSARQVGLSDAAARMTVSRYRDRLRVLICRELEGNGAGHRPGHDEVRDLLKTFEP
jgi:DNA-directed RNA polymerase specialized sigma24 family protein